MKMIRLKGWIRLLVTFSLILGTTEREVQAQQPQAAPAQTAPSAPAAAAPPQKPAAPPAPAEEPPPPAEEKLDTGKTLSSLLTSRETNRKALETQRRKLKDETSEEGKATVTAEIERLERRKAEIERDFNLIVTGRQSLEDLSTEPDKQAPLKLQDEVTSFLSPIFSELREMTRRPREVQSLEDELDRLQAQDAQARKALADVDKLIATLKTEPDRDPAVERELKQTRATWTARLDETQNRLSVVKHELAQLRDSGASFWADLGIQVRNFVFIRGANVLLALLAFVTVLFGLRGAYYYAIKLVPVKRYEKLSFSNRLLDVVHKGVSAALAVGAALLVLYARGDWLLGGLAVIALGALLMTAKDGMSRHLEDLQMMLNLGRVREGERVYIKGVPWRVGSIHMFTQLTNLIIGGPGLRLPLDLLATMTSRPSGLDEPWFPCAKRAYIVLGGTLFAQVVDITPDRVELQHSGGLRRWMPIEDFMKADVSTLSGGFARSITLGLDYRHQPLALTDIPDKLKEAVRSALLGVMREEEITNVIVEYDAAADSSLNFVIIGVFAGSQAANYPSLHRVLQRAALECATQNGWEIPFPQMVVRKAESEAPDEANGKTGQK